MGREHFTTFQNTPHVVSTLAPHPAKRRSCSPAQLLRPHEVPYFNTDFQGVIPAATLTFNLPQILCRHISSFLGEETPPDSPTREAQTPSPMLPLAFLAA